MAYVYYNPNPLEINTLDCSTRAVAKALGISWEEAHTMIFLNSIKMGYVMSSDYVWGSVLRQHGFKRAIIPNECPDCYTAAEFCEDNPQGIFVLGFGDHVATVVDGNLYDSWDTSKLVPMYYWYKEDDQNGPLSGTDGRPSEPEPAPADNTPAK